MAEVFNLGNALQAGDRIRANTQTREFNSLRLSGERQRQDIQQKELDADQQRANVEKLLTGIGIIETNPNILPRVLEEFAGSGILPREAIPDMLAEAQNSPETFQQKMNDFAAQLRFSISQGAQFNEPKAGIDPETGQAAFGQIDPRTGESRIVPGFTPSAGGGAFGGEPSAVQLFNTLSESAAEVGLDGKPTRRAIQAQTQLGTRARAGTTSSRERIATDEDLTESVAESEATIAQRRKFGEATGAVRSKLIDKGFVTIQSIDKNIRNLDKAIAAIDEGASTGAVESKFFPTIRKATVKLEQIQSELGLDVVGGVTFGALSKGELDLALTVALPVGLQPPELRQWLQDKKTAQEKLRVYYAEQVDFLDQGGTIAGFLRSRERGVTDQSTTDQNVAPEGTVITNQQGQQFIKQNGQWVPSG